LFQPEIVPLRLAKMKLAAPTSRPLTGSVRWKDELFVLETCPVGPGPPGAMGGMFTVKTGTGGGGLMSMLPVTE
jgi:hypothetical protein